MTRAAVNAETNALQHEPGDLKGITRNEDDKYRFSSSIYYGVRSYLHHFYEPANRSYMNEESGMEDDFEFAVEPGRRKRGCCWVGVCACIGLVALLLGVALILIGTLTPLENPIVGVRGNLEILDQRAIDFDENVRTCRLSGLICFGVGGMAVVAALFAAAYERERGGAGCGRSSWSRAAHPSQPTAADPHPWIRYADGYATLDDHARIPLSREIRAVQIEKDKR